MSMTPENATSWRHIAEQLTPKQVAELERSEQGYRAAPALLGGGA